MKNYASSLNNVFVFTLLLIICSVIPLQKTSGQTVLNNDLLRFGTGSENSINTTGNLQQPFYYNSTLALWRKLTFDVYPLDNSFALGGDGTNEWNLNGTLVSNPSMTGQVIDLSGYITTISPNGYGTIISRGTITINTSNLEIENKYELEEGQSFIKVTTNVKNISGAPVSNVRFWIGTRDDYVGGTDQPKKEKGNLVDGAFAKITNPVDRALALRISTSDEGVLFYTNSTKGNNIINSCCSWSNVTNQNPLTSNIEITNDGSYGFYVRMNDLTNGSSDEFTWYYAAGKLADLETIISAVAAASGAISDISYTTATFKAKSSSSGTGYYMVVPRNATAPTEVQIKAGVNYGVVTVAATGSGVMTASVDKYFYITGLNGGTSYDLYFVSEDVTPAFSSIAKVQFVTIENTVPVVSTNATISDVLTTTASSGGNISSDGGLAVSGRGVCWNTSANPTTSNSVTTNGTGTGSFASSLTGLTPGTLYYLKAYATNSMGTGYGSQVTFVTIPSDPSSATASATTIFIGSSTDLTATGAQGSVKWYTGSCGGTTAGSGNPLTVSPTVTTTYYARNYANSVYSSGCASVTITVNKYDQIITFDPIPGKTYGDADFSPASASSGLAISYSSSNTAVARIVAGKVHLVGVGSSDITASQAGNATYNPAVSSIQTLSVSKASLTVTANDNSKIYGASDPMLDYTVTGTLYNGDSYSVVTGVTLNAATGASATYGTHVITATSGTAINYNITHVNGTLTVSKAALTVTANNKAKVYGETDPVLVYTPSGTLYYTDNYSVITGVSLSTTTGASASFGTHTITVSGSSADNYYVTQVNGTLTVSKASLTVTANDKSKVYGAADPVLDYTPSGTLYYSDTYSVISGVSLGTATGASAAFGTHTITATGGSADNYNVSHINGTLTVSKAAALTVTANDKFKVYGESDPVLDYTPSGTLYYSDTYSVISGVILITETGSSAASGTHSITATGGSADNYNVSHLSGTLTVSKAAALTVTSNDKSKVYGASDPVLDYTPSGTLYYTDTYSVISGVDLSTETGSSATFGTHTITASGGSADNYDVTDVIGTLTVSKASLTVTANDKSKVYGTSDPVTDYNPSGTLYYSDTYSVISGVSMNTVTGASATYGTHTITVSGSSADNYDVTQVNGTLTVSKASLTVTANDKAKVYGATDPVTDYTPSGTLYYTDTYSVISGVSLSTATGASATTGTHAITASGGSADNYDITHVNGTLTVSKAAALTVTANDKSKVYGASDPVPDYTPSGTLYYADTYSVISGVVLSTETGASATFGTHVITATSGSADNYDVTYINGTLTVSKAAALTVTANNKSKVYGATDPVIDYTPSGTLYYSDTYSVIPGVGLSTVTGASATFGTHTITAAGGTADNYDVNDVNGTLTVSKALLTAVADNKSKIYGETNPVLTITYEGFKYSDKVESLTTPPVVSTSATSSSNAGTYAINLTEGSDNNYTIINTEGTLSIEKAVLNVTADDKSRIYGKVNPELTVSYSGFLNGDGIDAIDIRPVVNTSAYQSSDAGKYSITAEGGSDNNYTFEYSNGTLEIVKADQVLTFETIPAGLRTTQKYELVGTSTSGLPVRFESSENSIAEVSGNNMTVLKEGPVLITAIQEGDNNWNPAVNITQSIVTLPTFANIRSLFTPNNDGMNDYWYIPDIEQYGTISVQIYNRFGKLLYKSSAYKNDWDGTYNGTPLPDAAYYYIIKSSEKGLIKGVVNIVR
jgi:gliding motility-associated-like protein